MSHKYFAARRSDRSRGGLDARYRSTHSRTKSGLAITDGPGWNKHQRQHARVTRTDQQDQATLNAFHVGERPPVVRHLLRPL
ncbi:hypothetical protein DUT91_07870 [Phyllobacterium salinisoli]|uniref:Uncharacterized protein n=1 Tax=Phyllobacterium salinisoli TaxID=1899321 RepID=A0A368K833_9HYPH|nr:hypothetical protein DUT91_07870 [Phyllobacterium salinisoli]